ncbi:MAG: RidA family protein [Proteobacteria bacterium]|nr:RidA family protein [Pseudomonadota bacterium]
MANSAPSKLKVLPFAGSWRSDHPLSPGVRAGDVLWMAASAPIDVTTRKPVAGDITQQTEACFNNLEAHLAMADANLGDVVRCTVYLIDPRDIPGMNAVYERRFKAPLPGRATLIVSALVNPIYRVVIDSIAYPGWGPRTE